MAESGHALLDNNLTATNNKEHAFPSNVFKVQHISNIHKTIKHVKCTDN